MMKSTLVYDRYYPYEELTEALRRLAALRPDLAKLSSLNKTKEGRDIWLLEITDPTTGVCGEKRAYYVDGNEHAGEVTGSMAALYFADYLLTNADSPEVAELLKTTAFYIVPRKSPDGAEYYLTTPNTVRSVNEMYPYSKLMPGLQQKDMDGDGVIRKMRVKTPFGAWKISAKDPRVLVKRLPDDTQGDFYDVYDEGYIEEYDGVQITVAPDKYGNDDNRNYPVSWAPENEQYGAGVYPLSQIETKTSADFVIAHKNIASVITFHTWSGFYLYPPGMCSTKEVFDEDIRRYREMGKIAEEVTGYPAKNIFDDFTPDGVRISSGAFDDWCHYDRGIPAYTIECWDINPRAGVPHVWPLPARESDEKQESDFMKLLAWVDENVPENAFREWRKFDHPQLGEVEIGGLDYKYVVQNCPPRFLQQEVEKHARFMLRQANMLPRLVIDKAFSEKVAEGVYRVSVNVGNCGYLPTYLTREAVKRKIENPVTVRIKGAELLSGREETDLGSLQGFSGIPTGYSYEGMYTKNHEPLVKKAEWLVRGKPGDRIQITARCATAGFCTREVFL